MSGIILFIFGTIIGSFLNVLSLRYDPNENFFSLRNVSGRSRCMHCGKTLSWYELIPFFSFLFQVGKCRSCGVKLSWQYPLVELASGLIFLLPIYLIPNSQFLIPDFYVLIASIVWILIFLTFLLISIIDFRWYLIPDELNTSLIILGTALIVLSGLHGNFGYFEGSYLGSYAGLLGVRGNIWLNHLFGMLIGAGIVGLIIAASRGKGMGIGDLKLLGALGWVFGWPDVLFIFISACFIGAVASLGLMVLKKKTMKSVVPFGPFLISGAVLLFFFGEQLLRWYFQLFIFR